MLGSYRPPQRCRLLAQLLSYSNVREPLRPKILTAITCPHLEAEYRSSHILRGVLPKPEKHICYLKHLISEAVTRNVNPKLAPNTEAPQSLNPCNLAVFVPW